MKLKLRSGGGKVYEFMPKSFQIGNMVSLQKAMIEANKDKENALWVNVNFDNKEIIDYFVQYSHQNFGRALYLYENRKKEYLAKQKEKQRSKF